MYKIQCLLDWEILIVKNSQYKSGWLMCRQILFVFYMVSSCEQSFLIFAWTKTYEQKRSRVSLRRFLPSTVGWTWNIKVSLPSVRKQHWVMADCNYWQQFGIRTANFQLLSLTHCSHTNILSISMNSVGHKYIITRQETGCENNPPPSLLQHHVLAAVLKLCHLRCTAKMVFG